MQVSIQNFELQAFYEVRLEHIVTHISPHINREHLYNYSDEQMFHYLSTNESKHVQNDAI